MDTMAQLQSLGEIALAMLLGGLVGLERRAADKPAGMRTYMLVAGASAMFVGLAVPLIRFIAGQSQLPGVEFRPDPFRTVGAVVTGLSFLGAGTIFRSRDGNHVEGLTTAASLLVVGGLGVAVALHQFVLAIGLTVLLLFVLRGLQAFENFLDRQLQAAPPAARPPSPPATPPDA